MTTARRSAQVALLKSRGALPPWHEAVDGWAARFHAELTKDWAELPADVRAVTDEGGPIPKAFHDRIDVPLATPVFVRAIQDVVFRAIPISDVPELEEVRPGWKEFGTSIGRLCQIVGSIRDVSFPLFPTPTNPWSEPVQAACRFFYWHELGHVMLGHHRSDGQSRWTQEIEADKLGFAGLALEFRNQPELVSSVGFLGPALALIFIEYAERSDHPIGSEGEYPPAFHRLQLVRQYAVSQGWRDATTVGDLVARLADAMNLFLGSRDFPIISPLTLFLKGICNSEPGTDGFIGGLNGLLKWSLFGTQRRIEVSSRRAWEELHEQIDAISDRKKRFLDFCYAELKGQDPMFLHFISETCGFEM